MTLKCLCISVFLYWHIKQRLLSNYWQMFYLPKPLNLRRAWIATEIERYQKVKALFEQNDFEVDLCSV